MTNIVSELRELAELPRTPDYDMPLLYAAADEIERLRVEIERLRKALRQIVKAPFMDPDGNADFAFKALQCAVEPELQK